MSELLKLMDEAKKREKEAEFQKDAEKHKAEKEELDDLRKKEYLQHLLKKPITEQSLREQKQATLEKISSELNEIEKQRLDAKDYETLKKELKQKYVDLVSELEKEYIKQQKENVKYNAEIEEKNNEYFEALQTELKRLKTIELRNASLTEKVLVEQLQKITEERKLRRMNLFSWWTRLSDEDKKRYAGWKFDRANKRLIIGLPGEDVPTDFPRDLLEFLDSEGNECR